MSLGVATVGRKKPAEEPLKPKTVAVRATGEWAAWVEEGAEYCRTDVAKVIDAAVVEYLKARGFPKPPPRRIP
jgi:hypothetical protein